LTPVSFFVKDGPVMGLDKGYRVVVEAREIARIFVEARRTGKSVDSYPGTPPADLAAAYAIQDCALAIWGRPIGGWKVGRINSPDDVRLGTNRLAGPVFRDLIVEAGQPESEFSVFAEGFAAAEAEFMLRLAPQAGPLPTTPEQAMAWVDDVRIGIEIASSPYARINEDGPCVTVSDHGNNAGLLLGSRVVPELWAELDAVTVSMDIDGVEVGRATTATMLDGPFGALCFILGNLAARGIAPQAGWWISSGAITGVHQIRAGQQAVASFAGIGQVTARIARQAG
jgi:2-keto-4-pentenoate hydratase